MPKKIITKSTLPKIVRELDRWDGRLTWPLFCTHIAKVLNVDSISKHTMYLYPEIKQRFKARQTELRVNRAATPKNYSLATTLKLISELEAKNRRLEESVDILLERFRRWQYNAYLHSLTEQDLNKPLPEVDRANTAHVRQK